jgi:hypothetical protein
MSITPEQIKNELDTISNQVAQRLAQQQTALIQNQLRLEALIRMIVTKQAIPFDTYFEYIDSYVGFTNKLVEINKLALIADKIKEAQEFNTNSLVKIYADDLNILLSIKSTGGASSKLLSMINTLPSSQKFKEELTEILNNEEKEESTRSN